MQLYVVSRGLKWPTEQALNELGAKFVPDASRPNMNVQIGVRPINLYEIVFPESAYDIVMNTIAKDTRFDNNIGNTMLRKILKAKKCPPVKSTDKLPLSQGWWNFMPVGIRKDKYNEKGEEML